MNKSELKIFLKQNGFRDINEDDVFESDSITVWIDSEGEDEIRISFAHSEDGYYVIENTTVQQVLDVVSVFNKATFSEDTHFNIKKHYASILLDKIKENVLKEFDIKK
ncbi:MAG TPA: hypothetical protein PK289_00980 [Bacteroidia bacterium]|nr:hypothetical protein [Bacteroidia bacterium]